MPGASHIRAWIARRYGDPGSLELTDVPPPKLGPDSVLVRTRAVGLNPVDWKVLGGALDGSFDVTFPLVPCWDVAGVVEAVGPAVGTWAPGDEVIAYARKDVIGGGTLAEMVAVPVRAVAPKPASVGWAAAAALPLAGLTAYQALHDHLQVRPGDTLLVLAASGGVGTFAVQLGRAAGARVLGSASRSAFDYVTEIGGHPVERGEGLEKAVHALAPDGIDGILDLVGGEELARVASTVAPSGTIVSAVDPEGVAGLHGRYAFVQPHAPQLTELSRLVDGGQLHVELAEVFPFGRAGDALAAQQGGHVRGKLAVTLDD